MYQKKHFRTKISVNRTVVQQENSQSWTIVAGMSFFIYFFYFQKKNYVFQVHRYPLETQGRFKILTLGFQLAF